MPEIYVVGQQASTQARASAGLGKKLAHGVILHNIRGCRTGTSSQGSEYVLGYGQRNDSIELECSSCGARFRIRAQHERVEAQQIPCMKCQAPIDVPAFDGDGWRAVSHNAIFERFPERRALPARSREPQRPAESPEQPSRQLARRHASRRRATSFQFTNPVSEPDEARPSPRREVQARRLGRAAAGQRNTNVDDAVKELLQAARDLRAAKEPVEPDVPPPTSAPIEMDSRAALRERLRRAKQSAGSEVPDPDSSSIDVAFEPTPRAAAPENSAMFAVGSPTDDVAEFSGAASASTPVTLEGSFELFNEPEPDAPVAFLLEVGTQRIGPLQANGVTALVISGLSGEARISQVGRGDWSRLREHPDFSAFYELADDIDGERDALTSEPPSLLDDGIGGLDALFASEGGADDVVGFDVFEDEELTLDIERETVDIERDEFAAALARDAGGIESAEKQPRGERKAAAPALGIIKPVKRLVRRADLPQASAPEPVIERAPVVEHEPEGELQTLPLGLLDQPEGEPVQEIHPGVDDAELETLLLPGLQARLAEDASETPGAPDESESEIEDGLGEESSVSGASQTRDVPASMSPTEPIIPTPIAAREPVKAAPRAPEAPVIPEVVVPRAPTPDARDTLTEPDYPPGPAPAPRRLSWGAAILAFVVVLGVGGLIGGIVSGGFGVSAGDDAEAVSRAVTYDVPVEVARGQALNGARTIVHLATGQDFSSPTRRFEVARELEEESEFERSRTILAPLWASNAADIELAETYARVLVALEQYSLARAVAVQGLTRAPDSERLAKIFNEAVGGDPALHPETITLVADEHVDQLRALGGGKSISLKLKKKGKTTHAFKPSQFEWEEGWRAEVAAYLMCEALPCDFAVPKSSPARISKDDFEELYARHVSAKQASYKSRFTDLRWVTEEGPDGVEREYLYGVMKEWVPGFTNWPIEYTDVWTPWLDASQGGEVLDQELSAALSKLKFRLGGQFYRGAMSKRDGATTRDVARGLSNVLVFDFLTNNWDRFSSVEAYYGVNNQFDHGRFLSLDNGAAFHVLAMKRVRQRFELTSRFSRSMIVAARVMDRDVFNDVLFPDPSREARTRLSVFWGQRDALIERVDALVEVHGEDAVLAFE